MYYCLARTVQFICSKKRLFRRVFVCVISLCSIWSQSGLTKILASDDMASMACCAKNSGHSCANGFCRFSLKPKVIVVEKICGKKKFSPLPMFHANLQNSNLSFLKIGADDFNQQSRIPHLEAAFFSKSCEIDRSANSSNFNNRQSSVCLIKVLNVSQKPRPPTAATANNFAQVLVTICKTLPRESRPRAPPQITS